MRVSVVSGIASLLPTVQKELSRYPALAGVELVALAPEDCVAGNAAWARESRVVLADPGLVAGPPIDACRSLEWLQSTWAGVNALAGGRSDFACTKLSGCFGPLIAEHVFAHVLRVERRVDESWRTGRRKGDSSYTSAPRAIVQEKASTLRERPSKN